MQSGFITVISLMNENEDVGEDFPPYYGGNEMTDISKKLAWGTKVHLSVPDG